MKRTFVAANRIFDADLWVHPEALGTTSPAVCLFETTPAPAKAIPNSLVELEKDTNAATPRQRDFVFPPCRRISALSRVKLTLFPAHDELLVMNIRRDAETAVIHLTALGLSLLVEAVTSWAAGAEDFGIGARHATIRPPKMNISLAARRRLTTGPSPRPFGSYCHSGSINTSGSSPLASSLAR